jgi:hypothetical protein
VSERLQEYLDLPSPQSQRLIDFERAEVVTLESFPPQYVLAVHGTKPYLNMDVALVPRVYIRQPEYWGIEVVGSLPGIGLPAVAPYNVSLPLSGILGTRGIEVVGATKSEKIDVPPREDGGHDGHELPRELFKLWRHSFEEDRGDGVETYRPADFDFPPAFGRRGFEVKPDGEFVAYEIGPADEPLELRGRWTQAGPKRIGVRIEGREPYKLTIVSVDDEVLQVSRGR